MKYDSSMTHFHKDILAALQYMLKDDSEITEKFSPKDGSPAPLRDYLKQKYGKSCASHIGNGMRYSCNFSKGFELTFDTILNNPGDKNLTLSWSQTAKFIRDNWGEIFKKAESAAPQTENVPEEEKSEPDNPSENQIIPQNAGEISETFNYAVLSAEMGDYLKRKEQQLKNEYMNFTANCGAIFAEAQEKLAGSNQYNGLFEKWINSMGFKKDTVYRMINVHKFCSSQIATSSQAELFDSLSKSLQYEIAKPSAPAELVEQVLNGDITTHKDYIALKKQLEEARSETENVKRDSEKNSAKLAAETAKADELKRNIEELNEKNTRLALEIVKLEKRPVDVIVDSNEVNKRVAEAVNKINSETEQTLAAREQEFAETLHFKDERIWALEDKLKELGGSTDADKKIFLLSMTDEDYRKMLAELNDSSFRNILEAAAVVDIK